MAHLAKYNTGRRCARCQRASRDKFITPPEVPPEFWQTEQFQEAFAARHMGRVLRIPAELLWFDLPGEEHQRAEVIEHSDAPEQDPVLVAPWNHRGTVEAVVVLSGGGRVKRRRSCP